MKYSFESRIRYSEVGEDGKLTLFGLLNYFQDCTIFHSESIGLGVDHLEQAKKIWVLQSWQIDIARYPRMGEHVRVFTWPYAFKGFFGDRNFVMADEDGEHVAWANSVWVFMDPATGRPSRVSEEELAGYELAEKLDMDYQDRRVRMPEGGSVKEPITIRREYLDTNHHMNNGQYVRLGQLCLPADFSVKRLRAEYKAQAKLGDICIPEIVEKDNAVYVSLKNKQGAAYANMEFCRERQ